MNRREIILNASSNLSSVLNSLLETKSTFDSVSGKSRIIRKPLAGMEKEVKSIRKARALFASRCATELLLGKK